MLLCLITRMQKSFSILLSFILLASHMSLLIGTHFCGGEAVESKILFGDMHLGCEMSVMQNPCDDSGKSNEKGVNFDKLPCCENQYQTIQITSQFVKEVAQLPFNVDFAAALIYTTLTLDLFPNSTYSLYADYSSPPVEKDIQVLFQTFLI